MSDTKAAWDFFGIHHPPYEEVRGRRVVTEARYYLGHTYQHQGRSPGEGFDCIGLLLWVYLMVGWHPKNIESMNKAYRRIAIDDTLTRLLSQEAAPTSDPMPGDILVFQWKGRDLPQHVGMLTEVGPHPISCSMIHCCALPEYGNKVTEHVLGPEWAERLMGAYRVLA